MLLWFGQNFDLVFKYTPAITNSKDLDSRIMGSFEADLENVALDYQGNHIPYIKKNLVDRRLQYDNYGVDKARRYAYGNSPKVVRNYKVT